MKSIDFPEVTNKIGEDQEEFQTVFSQFQIKDRSINLCFELSDEDIKELVKTKKIWYKQQVGNQKMHPMMLSVEKSDIISLEAEIIKG